MAVLVRFWYLRSCVHDFGVTFFWKTTFWLANNGKPRRAPLFFLEGGGAQKNASICVLVRLRGDAFGGPLELAGVLPICIRSFVSSFMHGLGILLVSSLNKGDKGKPHLKEKGTAPNQETAE